MSQAARLTDLMGRELRALAALSDLLAGERASVQARDGAALERTAAAKRELISQLESLAGERSRLLSAQGLTADRAGFETLISRLDPRERPAAEVQWTSVMAALKECHEQNQVNGLLLDASMRSTQEALAILLGHSTRDSKTYDSQGALSSGLGTRSFAKV